MFGTELPMKELEGCGWIELRQWKEWVNEMSLAGKTGISKLGVMNTE